MKKQKILISFLILSFVLPANTLFAAENKAANKTKPAVSQLKGSVTDYRAEFINKEWWDRFNDAILSGYIYKAANANQDLKIATLKVQETQSLVRESLGKEMPSLDVGTNYSIQRTSNNVAMGDFQIPAYTQNNYVFPFTANYELDLWRKNREKTIAVAKELEAVRHDEKASYISITSAVAATYFNVIKIDKLIDLQTKIIDLRKEKFDLIKERNNYGLSTYSDVLSANKNLTESQSALSDLQKQQNIMLNQLAILTGDSVDNSLSLKRSSIDDIDLIKNLPSSIPSDSVMQRPDILRSETELQKSKINVSIAKKDFLPSFSITGQLGFNSNILTKAFDWDSYIALFGVNALQGLFEGGQKVARLKANKTRYEEMIQNYQKTTLKSFQEVNDSLVSLKLDSKKNDDDTNRVNFEKDNLKLVGDKYEQGLISHLDTLEYRERVLSLEKDQLTSKTDCLIDTLSLYKAVGGKLQQ